MSLSVASVLALTSVSGLAQAQSVSELSKQQKAAERRRAELEKQIDTVKKVIKSQETEKKDVVDRLGGPSIIYRIIAEPIAQKQ